MSNNPGGAFGDSINTAMAGSLKLLNRPEIESKNPVEALPSLEKELNGFPKDIIEQASIHVQYDIYPEKQKELVEKMIQLEDFMIPETFDHQKISALGIEAREKLTKIKLR